MVFGAGKGVWHDVAMSDFDVPQDAPVDEVVAEVVPDAAAEVVADLPVEDEGVVVDAPTEGVVTPDGFVPVEPEPEFVRTFEASVTLPELGGSLDSQIVVIGGVEYDQRFTPNPVLEAAARAAAEADSL